MKLTAIFEDVDSLLPDSDKNLILTKSSDFVKYANKDIPLFRGITSPNPKPVVLSKIRQDRIPVDSPKIGTLLYNEQAKRLYGVDSIRNRCAFASADIKIAKRYGSPQWIFPTNRTQIFYIPGIVDSFRTLSTLTLKFVEIAGKVFQYDIRRIFTVLEAFIQTHRYNVTLDDLMEEISHYVELTPEKKGEFKKQIYNLLDEMLNIVRVSPENIGVAPIHDAELLILAQDMVVVNPQYLKYPIHYDMFIEYLKR